MDFKYQNVMRMTSILLIMLYQCGASCSHNDETYDEELSLKSLLNGVMHGKFEFTSRVSPNSIVTGHYNLFPKSLGEILAKYQVQELDVSLTQGIWRYQSWGFPSQGSANPSGAHILAVFKEDVVDINAQWRGLVNALSGMICASLNFIDSKVTITPLYTFYPQGAMKANQYYNQSLLKYAILPQENVCTENLTPFKKLLPCYGKAGISSLLHAKSLFDSHYFSMSISVRPQCSTSDCSSTYIMLKQSLSVVLNYFTNGIKRSEWSVKSLLGKSTKPADQCSIAGRSVVNLDLPSSMTVDPKPLKQSQENSWVKAQFNYEKELNIHITDTVGGIYVQPKKPTIYAHRYLGGYGQEQGSIICEITNNNDETVPIVYTEYIPWFLRVYLHTMKIESNGEIIKPKKVHYSPGVERQKPYLVEILMSLSPNSTTTFTIQVEKLFLRWTEYPPDANLGFYIPSSIITAVIPDVSDNISIAELKNGYGVVRLYTEKLLVALPTPDFSMPYNVICLACTIVAIAFGSFHNLSIKLLVRETEKKPSLPKRIFDKIRGLINGKKSSIVSEASDDVQPANVDNTDDQPPSDKKTD